MITTFERGKLAGKLEALRENVLFLLEKKFGPLSPDTVERVTNLPAEQLHRLLADLLKAQSLKELQLQD